MRLTAVKLTVSILMFLTGSAAAERLTLATVPATPAPRVVGSKAVCKDANDFLRMTRTKLDGHEVGILLECDQAHTQIALETKDGWTRFASGAVGMREITKITKFGKRRVLVHRIDTRVNDDAETHHDTSRFDVCTYDKADAPTCGSVEVDCPETGCQEPSFLKGALWLHAKGGRKRFPIE
jgi:hypothetical protein